MTFKYNVNNNKFHKFWFSLSKFGPIFRKSFVSFTFHPYNNIQNSVFGFPKDSNFLHFVLQSARLSAEQDGHFDRSVPGASAQFQIETH